MNNSAGYCLRNNRIKHLYLVGIILLFLSVTAGVFFGETRISFEEICRGIAENVQSPGSRVFMYVRLPRTLAAMVCGAALSVSGAVIQNVFANRLASPGIIGVNAGAGLAVTVCAVFGIYGGFTLSFFSFAGALITVILISVCAQKWDASQGVVILAGVAINSLLGAFSDMIITFLPEVGVLSNDFKVGEFSAVTYAKLIPAMIIILFSFVVLITLHNELDVFTLGEDRARSLGMNTSFVRTLLLVLSALLSGCAVSIAGLLSFVGLMVPHFVRRVVGGKSLHLLSLCALYGASFVCLCDTAARCVCFPYEIPVGIIMAFLGAPFFVYILIKGKGGQENAEA